MDGEAVFEDLRPAKAGRYRILFRSNLASGCSAHIDFDVVWKRRSRGGGGGIGDTEVSPFTSRDFFEFGMQGRFNCILTVNVCCMLLDCSVQRRR